MIGSWFFGSITAHHILTLFVVIFGHLIELLDSEMFGVWCQTQQADNISSSKNRRTLLILNPHMCSSPRNNLEGRVQKPAYTLLTPSAPRLMSVVSLCHMQPHEYLMRWGSQWVELFYVSLPQRCIISEFNLPGIDHFFLSLHLSTTSSSWALSDSSNPVDF